MIKFGRRLFMSRRGLDTGQLIEFTYKGRRRIGVVIAPEYKNNCDVFVYDDLAEVPEELLTYIQETPLLREGDLWRQFGDPERRYRSFTRNEMTAVQSIEFVTYDENDEKVTREEYEKTAAAYSSDNSRTINEDLSE